MFEWHQEEHGFYIAAQESEAFGISFALVCIKELKDIQFSFQLGYLMLAIGYTFNK